MCAAPVVTDPWVDERYSSDATGYSDLEPPSTWEQREVWKPSPRDVSNVSAPLEKSEFVREGEHQKSLGNAVRYVMDDPRIKYVRTVVLLLMSLAYSSYAAAIRLL